MLRAFVSGQFAAFLLTGGIAALVNFLSRILYSQWMGFSLAVVLAYLTGMVTAYVLARAFVFTGAHPLSRSVVYFSLINLVAILQTWGVSVLLLRYALPAFDVNRFAPELAHAIGIMVPVFTSFLGHKHLTFRSPPG